MTKKRNAYFCWQIGLTMKGTIKGSEKVTLKLAPAHQRLAANIFDLAVCLFITRSYLFVFYTNKINDIQDIKNQFFLSFYLVFIFYKAFFTLFLSSSTTLGQRLMDLELVFTSKNTNFLNKFQRYLIECFTAPLFFIFDLSLLSHEATFKERVSSSFLVSKEKKEKKISLLKMVNFIFWLVFFVLLNLLSPLATSPVSLIQEAAIFNKLKPTKIKEQSVIKSFQFYPSVFFKLSLFTDLQQQGWSFISHFKYYLDNDKPVLKPSLFIFKEDQSFRLLRRDSIQASHLLPLKDLSSVQNLSFNIEDVSVQKELSNLISSSLSLGLSLGLSQKSSLLHLYQYGPFLNSYIKLKKKLIGDLDIDHHSSFSITPMSSYLLLKISYNKPKRVGEWGQDRILIITSKEVLVYDLEYRGQLNSTDFYQKFFKLSNFAPQKWPNDFYKNSDRANIEKYHFALIDLLTQPSLRKEDFDQKLFFILDDAFSCPKGFCREIYLDNIKAIKLFAKKYDLKLSSQTIKKMKSLLGKSL